MNTRGKRPQRNLSTCDKVRAIERIHNGETKASVSRDIGVPESTLRGWYKNEQKLRSMCRQISTDDQLKFTLAADNLPEKRIRFSSRAPTLPKRQPILSESVYSRLPLSGLPFPSNIPNSIFEKIAINNINIKSGFSESITKMSSSNYCDKITLNDSFWCNEYSQQSLIQNLNLIPMICSTSNYHNEPFAERDDKLKSTLRTPFVTNTNIQLSAAVKLSSNNDFSSNQSFEDTKYDEKKFYLNQTNPIPEPAHMQYIRNFESEYKLLEWRKAFNASLHFLALAAAAATVCHATPISTNTIGRNLLHSLDRKKYLNTNIGTIDSVSKPAIYISSDLSNNSYTDSEPEDLSVRSTITSKTSGSSSSHSQSPIYNTDYFSSIQNVVD